MSLIDLLLSQNTVLISFGFVVLILLLALFVYVGPSLRDALKRRAEARREAALAAKARKQQRAKARKRSLAQAAAEIDENSDADADQMDALVREKDDATTVDTTAEAGQAVVDANAGDAEKNASEEAAEQTEESDAGERSDGALQSLLESVFVDEEQQERYEILMRGVEVPDMESLAAFSQQIAHELHAQVDTAN